LLAALGCSSAPPERRGATLSEAAKEAEKDDNVKMKGEEKKVLQTTPSEEQEESAPAFVAGAAATLAAGEPVDSTLQPAPLGPGAASEGEDRMFLSLLGGFGTINSEDFDGFGLFGVGIGGYFTERARVDFSVLYLPMQLTEKSGVVNALVDEKEFALDGRIRYRFTPGHTFMGVYGLFGIRVGAMFWDYQNPITVDDGSGPHEVTRDELTTYAGYLGAGVGLVQTQRLVIGAEASAGLKFYESYTFEGFNQDLFDDGTGFFYLLISADYGFSL
jgi:hypothetical protein